MKSVDTNILVRVFTKDDPVQTPVAANILEQPVVVTHGVIMETEWVLRSHYKWQRPRIVTALRWLLDIQTVDTARPALVGWALDRYEAGADLADMLHIVASVGLEAFVSFEAGLDAQAGPDTPIRIERPS